MRAAGAFSGLLLLGVVLFVTGEALPGLGGIAAAKFLSDPVWQPGAGSYGLMPMLFGTLAVSLLALAIAAPLGIAAAAYETVFAPQWVAAALRRVVALLAGIPSVVYGLWGLAVLVPLLVRLRPPGTSLAAAALVLALMILPTIALLAAEAISAVPAATRQAATALGLGRWRILRDILLPAARGGIATGILLALARALGETMAVMMVAGNVVQIPRSLLDPMRTLTANIALEMAYAAGSHRAALFVSGLLVMVLTLALVLAARRLAPGEPR